MTIRGLLAAVVAVAAAGAAAVGWDRVPVPGGSEPAAGGGAVLDGATLFRAKGCASCHMGPDSQATAPFGPDLSDAAAWAGDRRPGMSAEDYVAESVRAPGAFISPAYEGRGGPPGGMPRLEVSDAELDALVDHLLGRRRGNG